MAKTAEKRQARLRERAQWLRGHADEKPHLAIELIEIADSLDAEANALAQADQSTNTDGLVCERPRPAARAS
jgi:hypothetical protein